MSLVIRSRRLVGIALVCLGLSFTGPVCDTQSLPEPQREQLLNGLRVLIWSRPADADVLIKLRIHSGAAFDLAGKSGEMILLGDILFPDPATREYFTEQMQGKLTVVTDYDGMTITMQGKATEFERIVEVLRNGIVATQLSPDIVNSVRDGRIKIVKETSVSPAMLADRAIAARLFGDFPYGQPYTGSVESLGRVDRADLMLARERFLNPNNATLTIVGGVQPNRILRTVRQLLGGWRKSEQIVPGTFRQPEPADARTLIVKSPGDESAEVRLATRGLSRSDKDAAAAFVLASVMRDRWQKTMPELARSPFFVRHEPRSLPGVFVMGASVRSGTVAKTLASAKEVVKSIATQPISATELEQAKTELLIALNKSLSNPDGIAEAWLDVDTYKLPTPSEQLLRIQRLSVTDVQRAGVTIFGKGVVASVVVGDAQLLRSELERDTAVEILGEVKSEPTPSTEAKTPKPSNLNKPD